MLTTSCKACWKVRNSIMIGSDEEGFRPLPPPARKLVLLQGTWGSRKVNISLAKRVK